MIYVLTCPCPHPHAFEGRDAAAEALAHVREQQPPAAPVADLQLVGQ